MSCSTLFRIGCVTSSSTLIAPDPSIRPLWSSITVKRPLKAVSLTQILVLTKSAASYTSLCRHFGDHPVKFPLITLRMPPVYWKVLEVGPIDMSCCSSSITCLKFIGSISTTETGVEDISPTESCTGCALLSQVDSCCPDSTTH